MARRTRRAGELSGTSATTRRKTPRHPAILEALFLAHSVVTSKCPNIAPDTARATTRARILEAPFEGAWAAAAGASANARPIPRVAPPPQRVRYVPREDAHDDASAMSGFRAL